MRYYNPASELLDEYFADAKGRRAMSKQGEPHIIRPYGDATGDGLVQVSFTLPIAHDKRAEGAALQLAAKMGLEPAMVVHAKQMGPHFTFFVVYGTVQPPGRPRQGRRHGA